MRTGLGSRSECGSNGSLGPWRALDTQLTAGLPLSGAAGFILKIPASMTGMDPKVIHGLTQPIATIPMFGWFGYASFVLLRTAGSIRNLRQIHLFNPFEVG